MLEDAQAFFAGIEKLASAQSLSEAFQIQSDMVRARTDVAVSRARATADYRRRAFRDRCEDRAGEHLQGRVAEQGRLIGGTCHRLQVRKPAS